MNTGVRVAILTLVLAGAPASSLAFPGGLTFRGKVKCMSLYNHGSSAAQGTDIVTLTFTPASTDPNMEEGTVALTHTEMTTAGVYLGAALDYTALLSDQSDVGMLAIQDPLSDGDDLQRGAIADFKPKPDGSIGALRIVVYAHDLFEGVAQRCSGTLKRVVEI